jgi:predicted PurR-regulated permease PerM
MWLCLAALAVVAAWFASRIPRTLSVFVIAAFIAFGVQPIVHRLERRMSRQIAIAVVYAGLLAVVVVLALLVVPATIAQVQAIAANAPAYVATLQGWIDGAQGALRQRFGRPVLPSGYGDLNSLIAGRLSSGFSTIVGSVTQILVGTFTAAFVGLSAVVLSGFLLARGEHAADALYELLPANRRASARALGSEMANVFGSYVSGQVALCVITGALIFAFSALAGLNFALLLGIVAGIAYAVPFAGMIVAHVIALVLAAPQGTQTVLWVQAIVFVVARVSDNLLVPRIMSQNVGVSPVVVMFAVFAGGELFGLPGLLLGIPAAALAKVAWRFYRASRTGEPLQLSAPAAPVSDLAVREAESALTVTSVTSNPEH